MSRKAEHKSAPASGTEGPKHGRVTLKAVNEALANIGRNARLIKADGYFYFDSGDAAEWLDKTVSAPTLGSRTLEEWLQEFDRLERVNTELLRKADRQSPEPSASRKRRLLDGSKS